ncbi:MAG: hypothetical protein UU73_C0001G0193 [Candidatus Daviesbacteria bacterium GW2011_GWA1_41_61]|uniref:Glycosyl transferase family 1 domain-containing protein n=1 Tax=Candidatus Daviesbacteria bacterium GW2011_GWA2_40_9 TaxID=1618424 RepID=A0A0G0WE50_9BACT|nr:MAG: hypothetical protein UU26_C0006G0031 [Candidatus Daviesbacteria bacterium GW2011_GWC1_40_9]KKR82560.1 MAG: hypothetical protein UU29_C0011G0007 [Candidatus Daviesbacteria bacterium GW2011_GWA2_40_9]KKR93012.1 MAG: hypothetical protein UU44_C0004G0194 [Candidatus Daviesbacteria bacterium GW2011_GWB1_41_15]KKS15556.1 MAG: hypothetical protein UU73_C0001G0193 [Candidatus Daviesbacteria bacterium GW2011_GWA1_41_61]
MKIALYTPYLDSFGGGERYILTIAQTLLSDHRVDLLLDKHLQSLNYEKLITDLSKRLNLNLSNLHLVPAPVGQGSNFFKRLLYLRNYNYLFYLTDGSIFYSTAKNNIIHFQVPFQNLTPKNIWQKIKIKSWDLAIYNSQFTRGYVEPQLGLKGQVIYPPVDISSIKSLKKKKYILSVGRFTSFTRSKKHQEMIEAFADIFKKGQIKGWSLHLAGSVEGDSSYVRQLQDQARGLPVFFYPDLPFDNLMELYGHSSIYWHAAGFGETDPAKMEHFGITTVEAMAAGCVPVVISHGGQVEIVEDGKSGFLWNNLEQLQQQTLKLIKDPKLMLNLSQQAQLRSKAFSKENFTSSIKEII